MERSIEDLRNFIRTCPVIDNHAHNILRPQQLKSADLLTTTTEAHGRALQDAPTSLPHLRAARQLRTLYDLPPTADWAAIVKRREELLAEDADGLMRKCFQGTQTILIDDGLDSGANIEPYDWHNRYTRSPCKRIVRIEAVAATILSDMHQQARLPVGIAIADEAACSLAWVNFVTEFEKAIAAAIADEEVVGFKSVVCYRTGLSVRVRRDAEVSEDGLRSFIRHYLPECVARKFRVEAKGMNDALVISACKLIAAGHFQTGVAKPLQFHTGLGDNDIDLLDSNPACLQPLIEQFPTVPIVLLHSSYPYTREAGYLATVYDNAYLDIGEVFPMVSRDGQEQIVRQALEITPTSKILWSTDGHHFPETYWLANIQGRSALEKVLCEYVSQDDLTVREAIQAARDILYQNSNKLYHLGLALDSSSNTSSVEYLGNKQHMAEPYSSDMPAEATTAVIKAESTNGSDTFLDQHPHLQFIVVQWLDYLNQLRSRWVPVKSFRDMVASASWLSMSLGNLGTLQNDHMSAVCNPVGQIFLEPCQSSLRLMYDGVKTALDIQNKTASVMSCFLDENRILHHMCPRNHLVKATETLHGTQKIQLLIGFEIEVTFCRRNSDSNDFLPFDTNHAWGTLSDEQVTKSFPIITEVATALQKIGTEVQQFHSEAGPGQYEFVLPPYPPAEAVDTLIQARQCIQHVAAAHDLRATFHPMPFPGIGTAAHAHISLNNDSMSASELEALEMSFMAAVLEHLPALCAFTMPQPVSYGRVVDDSWTGGTWIAWGTQNREVPLRRVIATNGGKGSRWEFRCLDGLANMYLALGAVLDAGISGVERKMVMSMGDCPMNPTKLSDERKAELGLKRRMPKSLDEALQALEKDEALAAAISPDIVAHYLAMKKAEQEMLNAMPEKERRTWLLERY